MRFTANSVAYFAVAGMAEFIVALLASLSPIEISTNLLPQGINSPESPCRKSRLITKTTTCSSRGSMGRPNLRNKRHLMQMAWVEAPCIAICVLHNPKFIIMLAQTSRYTWRPILAFLWNATSSHEYQRKRLAYHLSLIHKKYED